MNNWIDDLKTEYEKSIEFNLNQNATKVPRKRPEDQKTLETFCKLRDEIATELPIINEAIFGGENGIIMESNNSGDNFTLSLNEYLLVAYLQAETPAINCFTERLRKDTNRYERYSRHSDFQFTDYGSNISFSSVQSKENRTYEEIKKHMVKTLLDLTIKSQS